MSMWRADSKGGADVLRFSQHRVGCCGPEPRGRHSDGSGVVPGRHLEAFPSVTVLVPAHNERATIELCIRSILAQSYPITEIVVVADACTDDTAAVARSMGVTVREVVEKDKAEAQNRVLRDIHTDVVVGFDADTFPTPTCVELMVTAMIEQDLDATCATILPAQPTGWFIRARRYAYALGRRWWRVAQSQVGRIQVLTGAAYAFKTEAIKSIGGFPTVGISADMDATWALHRQGYRLRYTGKAVAFTVDPETFDQYQAQMRRWAAGYFQTMQKHRGGLLDPRAMLVVWTALFDLLMLPVWWVFFLWLAVRDPGLIKWWAAYFLAHTTITTTLVATVVGWKEALLGCIPYHVVNLYNKGLYLSTMVREWVLGRHYAAWTGRAGRATVITAMTARRKRAFAGMSLLLIAAIVLTI
jgi:poly-beta-1,6-N-acetyl-D-glucosamine synthase